MIKATLAVNNRITEIGGTDNGFHSEQCRYSEKASLVYITKLSLSNVSVFIGRRLSMHTPAHCFFQVICQSLGHRVPPHTHKQP